MALLFMTACGIYILSVNVDVVEYLSLGSLETLRHLKKDVTEARKGMECGLSFSQFEDLREGDLIQVYQEIEKLGTL
jgi:translation initiation factor IF-2